MARFEDTPGLFGWGAGGGTNREIVCDWCKETYPDTGENGDSTGYLQFGDLQIAECCFEKVENAVLGEMRQILPWFIRILESKDKTTKEFKKLTSQIQETLKK
jgi:hypothetical protein